MEVEEDRHLRALERMYHNAPCNQDLSPHMTLERGRCTIKMQVGPRMHHSGGNVHGHMIFKLLDDASFFAAMTLFKDYLLVTAQFNLYFTRPVSEGLLIASGSISYRTFNIAVAEATVFLKNGKEVAKGSGLFHKSSKALGPEVGYYIA